MVEKNDDADPVAKSDESLGLAPDRGDLLTGFAIVGAALIFVGVTAGIHAAAIALGLLLAAYTILSLILSLFFRDLLRGFTASIRWTIGFLGRWFSFW